MSSDQNVAFVKCDVTNMCLGLVSSDPPMSFVLEFYIFVWTRTAHHSCDKHIFMVLYRNFCIHTLLYELYVYVCVTD